MEPKKGDYIICNEDIYWPSIMTNLKIETGYFTKNIGQITMHSIDGNGKKLYYVNYNNRIHTVVKPEQIKQFSPNKQDIIIS